MPTSILFFGTPDFAVPSLKAIAGDDRFMIVGVVTQPDKPVGRHAVLTPSAVKVAAQKLGITTILQPEKFSDPEFKSWIESHGPSCDLFVSAAYGKIFPQWLLDLPKHGVINVHGSLLPRWRGAAPMHAAIAAGDRVTGITIMKTVLAMDAGPILTTSETQIMPDDTLETIHDRLAMLGAITLPETLAEYLHGHLSPVPQSEVGVTFCKTLTRDSGRLDWTQDADELARLVRAYHPWPGTWTMLDGKRLKIIESRVVMSDPLFTPGKTFVLGEHRPCVACDGHEAALELIRLQLEGHEPMNGQEFLNGFRDWEDVTLQ
jgi:methionyl-tRNA formyltransferase